jgi:hypothetical protein
MAMDKKEQKELWLGFARDAASRYQMPDEVDNADELVDDMIEVATQYADGMLDEMEERFGDSRGSSRRRSGRGKRSQGSEAREGED